MRIFAVLLFAMLLLPMPAAAQNLPIRLEVDNWKVEPGDDYQLNWMERSGITPNGDFILEECSDENFKDTKNYTNYTVKAHRKKFENNASLLHAVKYYRVRCKAWVRGMDSSETTTEEVTSNVVRVILVGTSKADTVPSFPDDPQIEAKKAKKDKDDKKAEGPEYPTMGRPDLVVSRLVLEPAEPQAGQSFVARLLVRNVGVVPSEGSIIRVQALGRSFNFDVEPLKPSFSVYVPLPALKANEDILLEAQLDPMEKMTESREDNNKFTRTIKIVPVETSTGK